MNETSKIFLVGISCFVVGAGTLFAWSKYTQSQAENIQLKNQLNSIPVQSPDPALVTDKMYNATPTPELEKKVVTNGSISGTVGYPSEGIPPLEIFVMKQSDHSVYFTTTTQTNQQSFTVADLPPDTYIVFAYPVGSNELAGGYTPAVACGLSVECTDNSLIPVIVSSGQDTAGVQIKDWYAPKGSFPDKP